MRKEDITIQREPRTYQVELSDLNLQVTEWPGNSDPVLLLHATGFHSRCWDSIARQLDQLHIFAVDSRFHGGSDRHGTVDWRLMAADIAELIERLDLRRIVGVGHSMGGYLAAYVAAGQLERFKQLVLIDPVIFPRDQYETLFKPNKAIEPSDNPVSRRKNRWHGPDEMFERFRNRAPFDSWQEQVLRDYCDYALRTVPEETTLQLACDPLHEASIYLNHQGNEAIFELLPKLKLPISVLRARRDIENPFNFSGSPTWPGLADALPQARDIHRPDMSHFIPMEAPDFVADIIQQAMEENWKTGQGFEPGGKPQS